MENAARWEEVGALIHTEGTTAASKGVMLTHANIASSTRQLRAWFPDMKDGEESILAIFPFFHPAGLMAEQNLSILAGWTNVLVPHPDPLAIIEITQKHKPTLLSGPPGVYRSLLTQGTFRKVNLSAVKAFIAGGAPIPPGMIRELKSLRDVPVINLYGLTETCSTGTATPWGGAEKPGTAGTPLPGTDLKIVDTETGTRQLPAGEAGEICFRGPQVMKGYHKKPAETAAVLKDDWLFTGDIGFLSEDGYLTVLDRKEDLIVAGGHTIYPSEIDATLLAHPEVLEACTIGVSDEHGGVTLKAYVVLKPGQIVKAGELIGHCRERLTPEKVPQSIEFIDTLPKSALGKIIRGGMKEKGGK